MEAVGELGGLSLEQSKELSDLQAGYTFFRDGDVLVAKITPCFENGKGALAKGLLGGIGFGTTELHVIRPNNDLDGRFLFYVTLAHPFRALGAAEMYGAGGQKRVPETFIRDFPIALPPRLEQDAIADFLDARTSAIDAVIRQKERLIELLQEKRQAVITRAVTKGLDPTVRMKDSGIEWLGAIPTAWAVVKIGHLGRVRNGSTPDRTNFEYWDNGTIPWLSSGKVNDYVITEADQFITERALRECPLEIMPANSVIVGMIGQGKTRGTSAITTIPACINQNMAAITVGDRVLPRFLLHVLTAAYWPLREFGRGGQQDALNCQILGAFRIPLPPIEEQRRIVRWIDDTTAIVDKACAEFERGITNLRESRQALITAAVTGKIDVRTSLERVVPAADSAGVPA